MLESLAKHLRLPDLWQHQAVDHLRAGADVIVSAPTGAGKTYIFELLHESRHLKGQAVYTVPTRALANDKFAEWKERGWDVGIATGDLSENIHAPVVVATLETQLERLLRGEGPACLVIDEYQMIADESRGSHYEGAIALAPIETRLLLLSGSVANPNDLAEWMRRLGRKVEVVSTTHRPVPLEDMPMEVLPGHLAKRFEGWWARLAAAVMLADCAPLLIFSPRRKDAEGIARSLANELPQGEPLALTPEQRAVCGKELANLIERRVAYHHSGLSYAARAGIIEPLAKAGQLRVVVATMGLAAGINFSVRSVHVASTKFHDGTGERSLEGDELLQMFGRAGRRGLDERGYVITTQQSPCLADARPARLHRSSLLAWPMFLRVMKHAALRNDDPFVAATTFAARLFAKVPPPLGLEEQLPSLANVKPATSMDAGKAIFGLDATEEQVLNGAGQWETKRQHRGQTVPMSQLWLASEERQGSALGEAKFVNALGKGLARIYKGKLRYGLELALGMAMTETIFRPTKALRRLLKLNRTVEDLSLDEFSQKHRLKVARELLPEFAKPQGALATVAELPTFESYVQREGHWLARFDLGQVPVAAYMDQAGHMLHQPPERVVRRQSQVAIVRAAASAEPTTWSPRSGSAIHAWRSLGLVDAQGVPTQRGEVVSFFQNGEGLAIAAALEDDSYPLADLVPHMANLRAGFRFDLAGYCESERLGAICRQTYGFVNHPGYLNHGLPTDYGEGACEVLSSLLHRERRTSLDFHKSFAEGDISRAYIEWLSLIRHITHAPYHSWPRWLALQAECQTALQQHSKTLRHLFHLNLPPLTQKQRQTNVKHYLLR
jgi:DEAD/DEAH box helicase/Helicase conserved C-terminal domain